MKMKGHNNSGNSRGRQYAIMLLLAFGAAILGVMILHKLREGRIFSILVKEKDQQLISLHLLLQKERDHNKEVKTKVKDMKEKMYTIRNQKMELDSRILEMQSTISSLKDELKTLETALEEKQNEIKFLRDKETEPRMENSQLITLTETLKQKETEIEELKQHIENPTNISSVSTDDPSNITQNSSNNFQNQVPGHETGNEENGDKVENTDVRASVSEAKSEKILAIPTNVENQSLQVNDEGRETEASSRGGVKLEMQEKESTYANETNQKRMRLRAKQQRRGGEKYNKKFRSYGQQNGKYKKIVDEVLQNRGMHLDVVETGRVIRVKDELNQDAGMGENSAIEEVQRNTTFDALSNTTAVDENNKKTGELDLSDKNINGVQVRLETNVDESLNQITEEENVIRKNETESDEMKVAEKGVEDYKESKPDKV